MNNGKQILIKKFVVDMHTTPATVYKILFSGINVTKCKRYIHKSKWIDADYEVVKELIKIGSAREVEESVAEEFIKDFEIFLFDN